jgi:hypothetical protein
MLDTIKGMLIALRFFAALTLMTIGLIKIGMEIFK